jgi:hypothetical protein
VNADPLHAAIHICWGLALLCVLAVRGDDRTLGRLALVFGVFYTCLAVLGVVVHHPFGLQLGAGENVFHFVVGPATLVVGLLSTRSQRAPLAAGAS